MTATKIATALILLAASGCTHQMHLHAKTSGNEPPAGITVSGQGEAKAAPDLARTSLGVEVRAVTVDEANAQANAKMAAVVQAVKQAGVADKDLRTHSYSINFEQEQPPPPVPVPLPEPAPRTKAGAASAPSATVASAPQQPAVPRGYYRVSNMVEVTVRDVSKVGAVLKAATDAGANNVWGVSFEIADPHALRAKAREQAIARAKQNAEELAKLAGVTLGEIVSVSESDSGYPMPMMKSMRAEMAQANDVPIEQGEIAVSMQVQLFYSLRGKRGHHGHGDHDDHDD
jgi:uncharacterized protein YggE